MLLQGLVAKLIRTSQAEVSELSLPVERLFPASHDWVEIVLNELLHTRVEVSIEYVIKLVDALLRVVSNLPDIAVLCEDVVRVADLTDEQLIDRHAALERLVRNLGSNLHQGVPEQRSLIDLFPFYLSDLFLGLLGEHERLLLVCSFLREAQFLQLLFSSHDFT